MSLKTEPQEQQDQEQQDAEHEMTEEEIDKLLASYMDTSRALWMDDFDFHIALAASLGKKLKPAEC